MFYCGSIKFVSLFFVSIGLLYDKEEMQKNNRNLKRIGVDFKNRNWIFFKNNDFFFNLIKKNKLISNYFLYGESYKSRFLKKTFLFQRK